MGNYPAGEDLFNALITSLFPSNRQLDAERFNVLQKNIERTGNLPPISKSIKNSSYLPNSKLTFTGMVVVDILFMSIELLTMPPTLASIHS